MAIENSVSIDSVLSTFVDSIDVFDCRLYVVSMNYNNILKTKSNFTLLLYIPFLGIGEWYIKCV